MAAAVYVQTNDATENEIVAFSRAEDGTLAPLGRYSTGGRGTGQPHLPSQGSVVLSEDGRWLLVVNAGSDGCRCSRLSDTDRDSPTASARAAASRPASLSATRSCTL